MHIFFYQEELYFINFVTPRNLSVDEVVFEAIHDYYSQEKGLILIIIDDEYYLIAFLIFLLHLIWIIF